MVLVCIRMGSRYLSASYLVCYLAKGTYWISLIPKNISDDWQWHISTYVNMIYQVHQYCLLAIILLKKTFIS